MESGKRDGGTDGRMGGVTDVEEESMFCVIDFFYLVYGCIAWWYRNLAS